MKTTTLRNFLTTALLTCAISGCGDTSDLGKIREGFEAKPETYDDMMKAANKYSSSSQPDKAMLWYHNAIANAESEYGPNDGRIASACLYDGAIARSSNHLGEAEEMYKRAYEIQKKILPANSSQLIETKKAYAETLVANYKLDEARKIDPDVKTPSEKAKQAPRGRARGKH